jgi:MYXO-CTERM domain-containing protein
VRSGGTWTEQAKLTKSGGSAQDVFGSSVCVRADTAIVGADGSDNFSGTALVFGRVGTTWTEQARLTASDAEGSDHFGISVSVDGDTALVGAYGDDGYAGSAYAFLRTGPVWVQQAKLTPSDAAGPVWFGNSVSLSGDTALIGAPAGAPVGAAYVFTRAGAVWLPQAKLTDARAMDAFIAGDVSLSGDTALVAGDQTSVLVFTREGTTWAQQPKLDPGDLVGVDSADFVAVAVSGEVAVVGLTDLQTLGAAVSYAGLANGMACNLERPSECSGFCVVEAGSAAEQTLCCSTRCADACEACVASKTGVPDGRCAPVMSSTDPDDECIDDGAPSCAMNGSCDGAGSCQRYADSNCTASTCDEDSDCASGHCAKEPHATEGVCCDQACTEACKSCQSALQLPGGRDGICALRADCRCSSSADCAEGLVCSSKGRCGPPPNPEVDSDCGCRVPGAVPSRWSWLLFGAATLVLRRRRARYHARRAEGRFADRSTSQPRSIDSFWS